MSKRWYQPRYYTPKPKEKTDEDIEYEKIILKLVSRDRRQKEKQEQK